MYLIALALLYTLYIISFFAASIKLNVVAPHYFLGFGRKLFSFKISDTQFTVGFYIPIIGLAKIYTFVNGEKKPMLFPWEFFDKPLLRRWIVTFSGAIGLFIIGTFVYIALYYFTPDSIITREEVNRLGIYPSKEALKDGFQRGDKVIALNGKDYTNFNDLVNIKVITDAATVYTVFRDGKKIDIHPSVSIDSLNQNEYFFSLLAPFVIEQIQEGSAAERAGLVKGDRILKVNNQPIIKYRELNEALLSDDHDNVALTVRRGEGNSANTFNIVVALNGNRALGIFPKELINYTIKENSLTESIVKGINSAVLVPVVQIRAFGKLFSGTLTVNRSISGPVRLASIFDTFWRPFATLAVNVILLNLLPLPMSAFWEMIPLAYEGVLRRRFPKRIFRILKIVAIAILVALFFFNFIMDINRLMGG